MAIAGRVAIVPKGDWSADATYKRLDAVTHNNTLYFAKKEVPAGTATSNTEYWSKSIVGGAGAIATKEDAGIVKPADGLSIAEDGTLKVSIDGTTLTMDQVNNVIKLADTLKDKINGAFPAANLINNLTTTEAGFGLDARQGKALDDKITEINGSLNNNSKKITLMPRKWAGVNIEGEIFNINEATGGIIFHPHMYIKEIHFIANGAPDNNGIVAQAGFCTGDASVPEVYTTGDKRISYVDYFDYGEHVFNINGSIEYFYIAGDKDLSITNLFGILY
ncbi:hypothetical protein [Roseburia faecis]|uniref:hypothetical protein n=1 Tax=Roseburia faecis TaxID=301302 RepID=UPI003F9A16CA